MQIQTSFARVASAVALLLGSLLANTDAAAQTRRPGSAEWLEHCKRWIERKGYPVDYVEQRTGKRQPGFAGSWKGNVRPDEARAGDVAIVSLPRGDGRPEVGAAVIESVEPPAGSSGAFLTISAMGLMGSAWSDPECFVADTFGRVVGGRIQLSSVTRVWRPSLPLE